MGSDGSSPIGGAFLLRREPDAVTERIFVPEDLPEQARTMADAVSDFLRREVLPLNARLEAHEPGLMERLLRQAGGLGILGMAVPEAFGGIDLPKSQILLLTETLGGCPSFAVSAGVHSGVATLPLLFYGSEDQKRRYLPRLATGECLGAFALSEAVSGSDALAAQTRATRSADGTHYVLNGAKMWITNGAFADLFTLFARSEGGGLSAFLVERTLSGVSVGREEEKLGLRGSSTTRVLLDNAIVPAENLVGQPGQGHRPALAALNLGRVAIAATALGMCKENLRLAARYAAERLQFGRPIAEFGLVRHKLAEMAIRTFALESMLYRTAGYLDGAFAGASAGAGDMGAEAADRTPSSVGNELERQAAAEYAIECAALKVYGTEALDYVVDEALQIHGGYGFSEEYAVSQAYRDARVFRIFEGTSEINRVTIVDQIRRRIARGPLSQLLADENLPADPRADAVNAFDRQRRMILDALQAVASPDTDSSGSQEVIGLIADLVINLFAAESAALRTARQSGNAVAMPAAAEVIVTDSAWRSLYASQTIAAATGSTSPANALPISDTIARRRQVADAVIEREGYPW